MIVYLAGRYSRKLELKALISVLAEHNIRVNSSWLDEPYSPQTGLHDVTPEFCRETAAIDIADIRACDTFVFFAESPLIGTPRGGRHVEFGMALAYGKRVVVIGDHENIFHFLPQIIHYPTVQDFIDAEGIQNADASD